MTFPAALFPDTAGLTARSTLEIGGCDLVALAAEYGTPLYVYDEATIRARARSFREAVAAVYPGRATVCYAAKAYCAPWLLRLLAAEGLGLDVVSGGELYAAARAEFPRDRIFFHGNNKSEDELLFASAEGVGRIVIDNLDEITLLARVAAKRDARTAVLLRVGPGVKSTHTANRWSASSSSPLRCARRPGSSPARPVRAAVTACGTRWMTPSYGRPT